MLLTEDREIVNIYNRKILIENSGLTMSNNHIKNLVDNYINANPNFLTKIQTHMKGLGVSGSMFKQITTPVNLTNPLDLVDAIFTYRSNPNKPIVWHQYTSVGGTTQTGYYRTGFPFGEFGIRPTTKMDPNTDIELVDKNTGVDAGYYPIEATVKVSQKKLIDTDIVTIIFTGNNVNSIYPGPQVNNVSIDTNIVNKLNLNPNSRITMNNLLEKNIDRRTIGDNLVPFVKIK